MTQFGDFGNFCRDSNIVVCNLFRNRGPQTCALLGFVATDGHRVGNLGILKISVMETKRVR